MTIARRSNLLDLADLGSHLYRRNVIGFEDLKNFPTTGPLTVVLIFDANGALAQFSLGEDQ